MVNNTPDYKKIYSDIIAEKFPDRKDCDEILSKKTLSVLDVIQINNILFNDRKSLSFNQKHRYYKAETIREILEFQKKNNLNNSQLSRHFKLSRNTITKWKKIFLV